MKNRLFLPLLCLLLGASTALAAPSNDNFANARTLTGDFDTHAGTTVGATRQAGEPDDTRYSTVWYKWTPTRAGRARFSALPTSEGYKYWHMSVWVGASLGNLKPIAYKSSSWGETRIEGLPVSAGQQYYICIGHTGSSSNNPGTFDMSVVLPTSSDLASRNVTASSAINGTFANALPLSGASNTVISYALSFSANEPGEPTRNPGYSSWYYYDATADGRIYLSVAGTEESPNFDYWMDKTVIAYNVDTYAEMLDASPVGTSSATEGLPGTLSFNVIEGQRYYIAFGLGRFRNGINSGPGSATDATWRVMTMSYSAPLLPPPTPPTPPVIIPDPVPTIRIQSPGRVVRRTFVAKAVVTHPKFAGHVVWRVNRTVQVVRVNGASQVRSKRFQAGRRKSKRPGRVVVAAFVFEPSASRPSSYDTQVAKSKFRGHR